MSSGKYRCLSNGVFLYVGWNSDMYEYILKMLSVWNSLFCSENWNASRRHQCDGSEPFWFGSGSTVDPTLQCDCDPAPDPTLTKFHSNLCHTKIQYILVYLAQKVNTSLSTLHEKSIYSCLPCTKSQYILVYLARGISSAWRLQSTSVFPILSKDWSELKSSAPM